LSGDIAGLGKIVQIVRATDTTNRSTTNNSWVDADISVTITPIKSTSALILIYTSLAGGSSGTRVELQLTDASDNPLSGAERADDRDATGYLTVFGYATPATTSATTYKARFRNVTGGTSTIYNATTTGQLFAIEVAA
jgi:hypothetical protein